MTDDDLAVRVVVPLGRRVRASVGGSSWGGVAHALHDWWARVLYGIGWWVATRAHEHHVPIGQLYGVGRDSAVGWYRGGAVRHPRVPCLVEHGSVGGAAVSSNTAQLHVVVGVWGVCFLGRYEFCRHVGGRDTPVHGRAVVPAVRFIVRPSLAFCLHQLWVSSASGSLGARLTGSVSSGPVPVGVEPDWGLVPSPTSLVLPSSVLWLVGFNTTPFLTS